MVGRAARGRGVRLLDRAADRVGLHDDAGLPSRHVPGRDRHPEPRAAGAVRGRPEFVETFFEFVAEEVRSCWPGSAFARWTRRSAASSSSMCGRRSTTGRPGGSICRRSSCRPEAGDGVGRRRTKGQDHGLEGKLDNTADRACGGALAEGTPVEIEVAVATSTAPSGRCWVTRSPGATAGRAAGRHDRGAAVRARPARASALSSPGDHAAARRRRERLRGQGAVRRPAGARSADVAHPEFVARGERRSPATSSSTAPRAVRRSSGASWVSASACATRERSPWSRGSATTGAST